MHEEALGGLSAVRRDRQCVCVCVCACARPHCHKGCEEWHLTSKSPYAHAHAHVLAHARTQVKMEATLKPEALDVLDRRISQLQMEAASLELKAKSESWLRA